MLWEQKQIIEFTLQQFTFLYNLIFQQFLRITWNQNK